MIKYKEIKKIQIFQRVIRIKNKWMNLVKKINL